MVASEAFAIKKAAEKYFKKSKESNTNDNNLLTKVANQRARVADILSNFKIAEKFGQLGFRKKVDEDPDVREVKLRAMIDLIIQIW